jgi:peptidoglycan/LPS O-acetylase OafA/YrhL
LCIVGFARNGLILLAVWAIGALILAFVPTDLTSPPHTIHGAIHALVALVAFLCGALGELLLSRSLRHDPHVRLSQRFLAGLSVVTLVCVVIVIVTVVVSTQIGVWGLLERIFIGLVLLWMLIVSIGLWQRPSIDLKSGL